MSIRNKQNSLAFKISLSFATVGLILIGALLHSILQIQRIDDRSENLLKLRTPITETSIDIIASTNQSMSALRDWFITEDDNYLVKQKQLWENNIKPDIASLNEFSLASLDEDNQFNVNVVVQNLNKLEKLQEQVIAAKKGNNTQAANVLLVDEAASTHQRIISQLEYSIDSQQSVVMSNLEKIRELIERLLITDWSFLIIGLLLCFIFGIIISKSLSRPINRLVKFALNLSKGNLEQEINITDSAEFQTLSEALNKMVSTFRGLANVTEDMAMGDYSHRVVVKSEQDRLALSTNQMLENFNQIVQQANAIAKGDYSLEIEPRSEHDVLGTALRNMTQTLNQNKVSNEAQNWLKDGVAELSTIISGQHNTEKLCGKAISTICRYLNAGVGAMYLMNDEQSLLQLMGTYAYTERQALANQFKIGEGIVGQVALENKAILLNTISEQECMINSGTSQEKPNYVYAMPISYESSLISVIEIAYNSPLTDIQKEYIKQIMPVLATQLQATKQQTLTTKLLKDSKLLTNQLQTQQEELKATNEELEQQTQILKSSEEELRLKDEQQQAINKKLEERTVELEKQKQQIEEKNIAVREAGDQLKKKNEELEAASQYKSEFLANMSHELRTPLNSLLILAKLLADNEEGNLDEEQVESAQIMYKSGQDLLALINDILDLAKVEAGKIDLHITSNVLQDFTDTINRDFTHVTTEKGIELITEIHGNLPDTIVTDDHRVHQIIRNLMSNAIKFTEQGHVKFSISRPDQSIDLSQSGLTADTAIAFAVQDTGIGIPEEKQAMVFNSFQQADGTTSRHYGGTGLGLSISTQLAELLGGQITLTSVPGKGSTFTLYLPEAHAQASQNYEPHYSQQDVVTKSEVQDVAEAFSVKVAGIPDDRDSISKKDHVLLIVEDDLQFTKILFSMCHKKGFKCLHSAEGGPGMALARQYQPSGILLDLGLPDMDGLTLLDKLKSDSNTQNIPVHIISASDQETKALQHGAIGYLTKPINQEQLEQAITQIEDNYETNIHDLLIVEDNKEMLQAMTKLLNNKNVNITGVQTGEDALQLLEGNHYDCVILDLGLPDISGQELLQRYHDNEHTDKPAVIIHTGKSLSEVENMSLETLADSIIIKGSTASMDRLIDETQAFLNRVVTSTPSKRQDSVKQADTSKKATKKLFNHKVLIVDDDMRNIFALSKSLKSKGINVIMAANGKTAIEALEAQPDIDAVLMDIMMPVMDGYEAISIIRQKQEFKELPIIALTAKAMKGDKEKCIEVGASDFLSKPLNIDELISKLQQWLVT